VEAAILMVHNFHLLWRIRYNEELNTLLEVEDIRFIKPQRIRWLRHERMEDNAMPKRMLKGRLYSRRRKRRPRM
jgi:hypothetical protein